ncbi:MAG: hypothetical protein E2O68_09395 [Deltaproteobacteria bacterium]|nr:MAG: hypothetical protein E2O68_09395 [Deltaproteobacteria bacterium]
MLKKLFILFFLLSLNASAQETADDILILDKSSTLYNGWSSFLGQYGRDLGNITKRSTLSIFLLNNVSRQEFPVYQLGFGDGFPISLGINLGVGRQVINNKNILDTYTVIDRFLIGIRPRVYFEFMGFRAGASPYFNIEINNIRQVTPQEFTTILPLRQIKNIFKKEENKERKKKRTTREIKLDAEKYDHFIPPGDNKLLEREASYGKLWNIVTQTFKLPLHYKRALALDDDEIISYDLQGGVTLGVSFGIGIDPSNSILRTGVDASFYIKGNHQISVLKEAPKKRGDKFVRVKLSRSKQIGAKFGFGSYGYNNLDHFTRGKMGPMEGNFIWKLASGAVVVRPFRVEWNWSKGSFYDAVYRFDLNKEEGRKAYNRACLGFFKLAEKYSMDPKTGKLHRKKGMPVTRLLTMKEKRTEKKRYQSMQLFLFRLHKQRVIRHSEFTIVDEMGEESKYYETEVLNSRQRNALFAFWENRSHQFLINTNLKTYDKKPIDPNSLYLKIKVERRDDNTSSDEYMDYVKEVEESLDLPGMFPYPPLNLKRKPFLGSVGRTRFNYELRLNRLQIEKVINYPQKKMWSALIKGFSAKGLGWETKKGRANMIAKRIFTYAGTLPLSATGTKLREKDDIFVAKMKYSRWKKLKKHQAKGPKKLSRELGEFFNSGDYGPEMIKLLRVVLDGEKIPYSGSASGPLIYKHDNFKFGDVGKFIDPTDAYLNKSFANYREKFPEVRVSKTTAEILGKMYIRFMFHLDKVPKTVFFNLQKKNTIGLFTNKSLGTVVMENKHGRFKKGLNIIHLTVKGSNHPLHALVNQLNIKKAVFLPDQFKLNVAASLDGYRYGVVDHNLFRLRYFIDPKALEKFTKYSIKELDLCLGRTAANLMLFLGDRRLLICPDSSPHNLDGTCKRGMTPYDHYKNRPEEENIKRRDKWILKNCPVEGPEQYVQRIVNQYNVCRGRSGRDIIRNLGGRTFYVCPPERKRDGEGFCLTGMVPYKNDFKTIKENKRSRNEWIMKYCPLNVPSGR